jgi:Leucine-rich repeat (LRR) protein
MSHNHLTEIPRGAFDSFRYSLVDFDMSYNNLTEIPMDVRHLTKLTNLHIEDNILGDDGIPDNVRESQIHTLTHLFLDNTNITRFPPGVTKLGKLTTLYARKPRDLSLGR